MLLSRLYLNRVATAWYATTLRTAVRDAPHDSHARLWHNRQGRTRPGSLPCRHRSPGRQPGLARAVRTISPTGPSFRIGYLAREPADSKDVTLEFTVRQRLQFRLRANPTKKIAAKNERLGAVMVGKRVGLATETEQIRWLLRKGEKGGFRIPGEWVKGCNPETGAEIETPNFRVDARPEGRVRNSKPGHDGDFHAVLFEGVLEVTEPAAFLETIVQGIGSAKAFGFGLLSVARA